MMDEDGRQPVHMCMYVDACTTGDGALCQLEAYYTEFTNSVLEVQHPICHLEVFNTVIAVSRWVPHINSRCVTLYSDSAMAVAIFQAGKGERHVHTRMYQRDMA